MDLVIDASATRTIGANPQFDHSPAPALLGEGHLRDDEEKNMNDASSAEFTLINWIRQPRAISGPGPGPSWASATIAPFSCANPDTTSWSRPTCRWISRRHFRLDDDGPHAVGTALGVNLSDIAAIGRCSPRGRGGCRLPASRMPRTGAQGLHRRNSELAERFDVDLVGGDTNAWTVPRFINVTLLGETTQGWSSATFRGPAGRCDPGHRTAGRQLLRRPAPPPPAADRRSPRIAPRRPLHALIDISDGLSSTWPTSSPKRWARRRPRRRGHPDPCRCP